MEPVPFPTVLILGRVYRLTVFIPRLHRLVSQLEPRRQIWWWSFATNVRGYLAAVLIRVGVEPLTVSGRRHFVIQAALIPVLYRPIAIAIFAVLLLPTVLIRATVELYARNRLRRDVCQLEPGGQVLLPRTSAHLPFLLSRAPFFYL